MATFYYSLAGVALRCELECTEESGDGWNEPHQPREADLLEASVGNADIYEILSESQKREIELAFLARHAQPMMEEYA